MSKEEMSTIAAVVALKEFFWVPGKPVTFEEIKELGIDGIRELAGLCLEQQS